jgi:surface antigen
VKRTVVALLSAASGAVLVTAPGHALDLSPERLNLVDVPSVVPAASDSSVAAFVPRASSCRLILRDGGTGVWKGPKGKTTTGFLQFPWTQAAGSNAGEWRARIKCKDTVTRWKSKWARFTVTNPAGAGESPTFGRPYSASVSALSAASGWQIFGTTLIKGTDWFYGRGVDVRSNGVNGCASGCAVRGTYGTKYQCVELVNRFVRTQGWVTSNIMGNAHQILANAPRSAFDKHPAGDGYIPVPGDVIVWTGGSSGYGHVAVVSDVAEGYVTFVEQNASRSGSWRLKMDSTGRLARYGALSHSGYLHAKANV